jgi:hypothetical protein
MIHKQTIAVGIALSLLLIVYTIATATGWQESAQLLTADPGAPVSENHNPVAGATDAYSGHTARSSGNANSSGYMVTAKKISGSEGEVQAVALEDSLNSTWLFEWVVRGIGALALLTAGLLGFFSLAQRSHRS